MNENVEIYSNRELGRLTTVIPLFEFENISSIEINKNILSLYRGENIVGIFSLKKFFYVTSKTE
jgi:hypothetical protein